jgi:hypothetical protein
MDERKISWLEKLDHWGEHYLRPVWGRAKKLIDDEARFRLMTTLKIAIIPLISAGLMAFLMKYLLKINLIFFEANGFTNIQELKNGYYEYVLMAIDDFIPYFTVLYIILVFAGLYISYIILRPFKMIGDYCDHFVRGESVIYNPGFVIDLRILSSFSEYFFNHMENALETGLLAPAKIMRKFMGIHRPVFERGFFMQFFSLLVISSIASSIILMKLVASINSHLVELSIKMLRPSESINYFISKQGSILESMALAILVFNGIMYVFLAFHLYERIARPAFGIFSTMRSFIKGDYNARVHLLGHNYARPQCRRINSYLEYVQNEFVKRGQATPPGNQE